MKTSYRVTIAVLLLIAGLPILWAVFATFEAISISAVSDPPRPTPYAVAYVAWWLGMIGIFLVGQEAARSLSVKAMKLPILLAIVGIAGCAWLEFSAYSDIKRIVPIGTASIPMVCALIFGCVLHRSHQPDPEISAVS